VVCRREEGLGEEERLYGGRSGGRQAATSMVEHVVKEEGTK
jgi:hypothetical protein